MRLNKLRIKKGALNKKIAMEDLRYLQKKISGKSVYRSLGSSYRRTPKHRYSMFAFED